MLLVMVVEPSLLSVVKFFEVKCFRSFSEDFHWIVGVGLPVAEHETTTSDSEVGEGFTSAVNSEIPGKYQKDNDGFFCVRVQVARKSHQGLYRSDQEKYFLKNKSN